MAGALSSSLGPFTHPVGSVLVVLCVSRVLDFEIFLVFRSSRTKPSILPTGVESRKKSRRACAQDAVLMFFLADVQQVCRSSVCCQVLMPLPENVHQSTAEDERRVARLHRLHRHTPAPADLAARDQVADGEKEQDSFQHLRWQRGAQRADPLGHVRVRRHRDGGILFSCLCRFVAAPSPSPDRAGSACPACAACPVMVVLVETSLVLVAAGAALAAAAAGASADSHEFMLHTDRAQRDRRAGRPTGAQAERQEGRQRDSRAGRAAGA